MAVGYEQARHRLVRRLETGGIRDRAVLDAVAFVPRERFVDEALRGKAYDDVSLPIGERQTISQPSTVARMAELAGSRAVAGCALEIGSGSGYGAAVLSRLFARVYSVERIPALSHRAQRTLRAVGIENVHFKIFDGSYGWAEFAPDEAILVTAAVPELPAPLLEQLADGGRLVAPLASSRDAEHQILTRVVRRGEKLEIHQHSICQFVPLLGRYGMPVIERKSR